jgi:hypothetical protein
MSAGVDASREGNCPDVRMGHQAISDDRAAPGNEVHDAGWKSGLIEDVNEFCGAKGR